MRFLTLLAAVALQGAYLAAAAPSNLEVRETAAVCYSDCRYAETDFSTGGCTEIFQENRDQCVRCVSEYGGDLEEFPNTKANLACGGSDTVEMTPVVASS